MLPGFTAKFVQKLAPPSALIVGKATSAYLDVLRILAALTVFVGHWLPPFWRPTLFTDVPSVSHSAVVVFFVLSGYVIAYSSLGKKRDLRMYALARLSRLYSVVIPALVLSAILLCVGLRWNPSYYHTLGRGHEVVRFGLSAFFLQQVWFLNGSPSSNAPIWSLGYEFWYYVIFGAILYGRAGFKWFVALAAALLAGPNILLLMPVWWTGVVAYEHGGRIKLDVTFARLGFGTVIVTLLAFVAAFPSRPSPPPAAPFYYSSSFLSDYILGGLVGVSIWLFHQGFGTTTVPATLERSIRWMAGQTFSLYLYHYPLLVFILAMMGSKLSWTPVTTLVIAAAVLAVILGLGALTESKRKSWQNFLGRCWSGRLRGAEA